MHFKSKSNTQEHTDDEPFHPRETEKNGGSTCRVHLGGVLVAAGSSGMAQAPGGASAQASLLLYFSGTQQAGSLLELKDATGKTLAAYTPEKSYQSAAFSAPGMAVGETYSVYVDGEKAAEVTLTGTANSFSDTGEAVSGGMGGGMGGAPGSMGGHGGMPGAQQGGAPQTSL